MKKNYFQIRSEKADKEGKSRKMTNAEKVKAMRIARKQGRSTPAYVDRLRAMK